MRLLLYIVLAILAITFLRMVIGVVMRGASTLLGGGSRPGPERNAPAGGALKRDPVCGTYVSPDASVKKTVGNETVHFCSAACRDKYTG